jgi:17beta-estradiol 17-dehydrogenase / very-long-chain 3-oxoacyl-CoA reductase
MIIRNEEKANNLIKELSVGSASKFKVVVVDFNNSLEEGFFDRIYK